MKPAAAEAKKAQAMQAMADQLAENNRSLEALTEAVLALALKVEKLTPDQVTEPEEQESAEVTESKPKAGKSRS